MARVQDLQKVKGLSAPNFSNQNPIRAMSQRCFEQIANRDGWCAVLFAARFKADEVCVRQLDLGGVFDEQT
jgi:hypothetical protein